MPAKRTVVLIGLVWMFGLFVGALFGPRIHVVLWSAILDWHPDVVLKNRACLRLKNSEIGKDSLYDHLASPNEVVRKLSVCALVNTEDSDAVALLLRRVPEARVDERIDILRALYDTPRQYSRVAGILHLELKNDKNSPRVKTEIAKLLRSIEDADRRLPGARITDSKGPPSERTSTRGETGDASLF